MKNFRTHQLAVEFYKDCQSLKLPTVVKDQFERALLSIPLNLAEGSAKPTLRDRQKFYFTALGSMREVQTILQLFGTPTTTKKSDTLAAHIYRLCHPR